MLIPTITMHLCAGITSVILLAAQIKLTACICTNPIVRQDWRALSNSSKLAYIDAVKCLQSYPSKLNQVYPGVRSRFDDFQATHINSTDYIHWVGYFQPWHRMFLAQYESDLRNLCGYQGAQPYWDWTLDVNTQSDFLKAPVFDPVNGFGGNGPYVNTTWWTNVSTHIPGKTGGGCITTGQFVNMSVNLGPGKNFSYNPRCLARDFSPWLATQTLNASVVNWTLQAPDFYEFDIRVEGGIDVASFTYHSGGHKGIGGDSGEISDLYSSPGEPLFYLHHANIDRLWNMWQHLDWPSRLSDISGPDTQFAYPYNFLAVEDKPYHNITLGYKMDFQSLLSNGSQIVMIQDVMDTQSGRLCYTYS